MWVGSREAFFNVESWVRNGDSNLRLEDFEGEICFLGLDLASKVDICAIDILFPVGEREFVRFGKYYLPYDTVMLRENEHYQGWMQDGWLTVTDGNITDYNEIKADILDIASRFQVQEICFDPYQSVKLITELMDEGLNCVEIKQTVPNFSEPMKEMDALCRAGKLKHNGDPVMTWMVSNVVAKEDAKDNVYPRKERNENKIDGVVAEIMALNRAIAYQDLPGSIYENDDILDYD